MLDTTVPVRQAAEPFHWILARDVVPRQARAALVRALPPLERFTRAARRAGGDKQYAMYVLPLVAAGAELPIVGELGAVWRRFVGAVAGAEYRAWVGRCTGVDVTGSRLDLGVFCYGGGDFITPHTDKAGKLATHVVYLNEEWGRGWGGGFQVRSGPEPDVPPVATVAPHGGASVLFARTDASWHSVEPMRAPAGVLRRTVQIEMWA